MAYDLWRKSVSGRDWSLGSVFLPAKDRDKILNKIDDVRFDIRNTRFTFGTALFAIAGGLTFLGITKIYETRKARHGL